VRLLLNHASILSYNHTIAGAHQRTIRIINFMLSAEFSISFVYLLKCIVPRFTASCTKTTEHHLSYVFMVLSAMS